MHLITLTETDRLTLRISLTWKQWRERRSVQADSGEAAMLSSGSPFIGMVTNRNILSSVCSRYHA
jgi:hypothetical protein